MEHRTCRPVGCRWSQRSLPDSGSCDPCLPPTSWFKTLHLVTYQRPHQSRVYSTQRTSCNCKIRSVVLEKSQAQHFFCKLFCPVGFQSLFCSLRTKFRRTFSLKASGKTDLAASSTEILKCSRGICTQLFGGATGGIHNSLDFFCINNLQPANTGEQHWSQYAAAFL